MSESDHISACLAKELRQKYIGSTQDQIAKDLDLSQSIISRLLNASYAITSPSNKIFENIASKLGYNNVVDFWEKLIAMKTVDDSESKFGIGMSSYAVYTAPFIHSFLKDGFPAWLRLGYTHKIEDKKDKDNNYLIDPEWWDSTNFHEKFKQKFDAKAPESGNPFEDCYVSDTLLSLIDSPSNLQENRKFQAVFVPKLTQEQQEKADLVEVATIFSGYGSLILVVGIEDFKEETRPFNKDEKLKKYRIKNCSLTEEQWLNKQLISKNKSDFLSHLEIENNEAKFFVRGVDGSSSFDLFKKLWNRELKLDRENEDFKKFEYLMATRDKIDYSRYNDSSFDAIASLVMSGKKLVMVAHPPFLHNSWQRIKQSINDYLDQNPSKFIQQYRYNFTQWIEPQKYVLYISKNSINIRNIQLLNELLINVEKRMSSAIDNDDLRDFFYYNPVQNNMEGEKIETNFLYNLACTELCFTNQSVSYSTNFVKLLLQWK